jgi:FkbM family methyltransferase
MAAHVTAQLERIAARGLQFTEWHFSRVLLRRAPWLQNRFGQRYQAMCFADYMHLRHGNPEMAESAWMERHLRAGDLVLDVGANHGMITLECALLVGQTGRVHAFEPAPQTRDCLMRHLEINDIHNVSVFDTAVSSSNGKASLHVYESATGLTTLADSHAHHPADKVVRVNTITLDEHCDVHKISTVHLLKLDIEGHELSALRGARRMLTGKSVRAMLFEVGDVSFRNANVRPADLLNYLRGLGYGVFDIAGSGEPGARITSFPPSRDGRNYLALPEQ